ncbi:MAG: hypothetical protein ACRERC_02715 [Candidatus Binatia bacterium]
MPMLFFIAVALLAIVLVLWVAKTSTAAKLQRGEFLLPEQHGDAAVQSLCETARSAVELARVFTTNLKHRYARLVNACEDLERAYMTYAHTAGRDLQGDFHAHLAIVGIAHGCLNRASSTRDPLVVTESLSECDKHLTVAFHWLRRSVPGGIYPTRL